MRQVCMAGTPPLASNQAIPVLLTAARLGSAVVGRLTNGIVELTTIYPAYYDDCALHIHLMVHRDWVHIVLQRIYARSPPL